MNLGTVVKKYLSRGLCVISLILFIGLSGCVSTAQKSGDITAETDSDAGIPSSTSRSGSSVNSMARNNGSSDKKQPGSAAYKLQDCKPVDEWNIIDGGCSAFGKFHGKGIGVRNSIMFIGNFENGVPQGKGMMCFRHASRENDQRSGRTSDCGSRLVCNVEFKAGKIHGSEMTCTMGGRQGTKRSGVEISLHSPSGFFIDDGAYQAKHSGFTGGKVSNITTDQARVEISGDVVYMPLHSPLRTGNATAHSSAVGELRQVSLREGKLNFDRFAGLLTISGAKGKTNSGDLLVKGVFKGVFNDGGVAHFSPYPFATPNGRDIAKESLVELSHGGKSYEMVFDQTLGASGSAAYGSVIYYKDSSGIEFDGTYPGCAGKLPLKRFGSAGLRAITKNGSFQGYEINPGCGTITTPNGSYSGMFRNGRPE